MFFRKLFLPWTMAHQFPCDTDFYAWLGTCSTRFNNLRMICLIPAAILLLVGYMMDNRPIMLLTILPLILVLLLTMALDRIDRTLDGQNNSQS